MSLKPVKIFAHKSYAHEAKNQDKPYLDASIDYVRKKVLYEEDREREEGTIFEEDVSSTDAICSSCL